MKSEPAWLRLKRYCGWSLTSRSLTEAFPIWRFARSSGGCAKADRAPNAPYSQGGRDRKTVLEALRCGACGYLLKNSSAAQLADALNQLMQGGIYVSPQVVVMRLFAEGPSRLPPKNPLDHLSSREFQVFSLLVDGIRAKEIAARLALSPKTVDTYRSSLMRKLEI